MRTFLVAILMLGCSSKHPVTPSPSPAPEPTPAKPAEAPAPPEEPKPDPAAVRAELITNETAAWETAKPVVMAACGGCHTKAGKKSAKKKLDHMNLDTYPIGGHHTAMIGTKIREVLAIGGGKATMPDDKPGSVKGEDLAKIEAWVVAWEAADKGGAHTPM